MFAPLFVTSLSRPGLHDFHLFLSFSRFSFLFHDLDDPLLLQLIQVFLSRPARPARSAATDRRQLIPNNPSPSSEAPGALELPATIFLSFLTILTTHLTVLFSRPTCLRPCSPYAQRARSGNSASQFLVIRIHISWSSCLLDYRHRGIFKARLGFRIGFERLLPYHAN